MTYFYAVQGILRQNQWDCALSQTPKHYFTGLKRVNHKDLYGLDGLP